MPWEKRPGNASLRANAVWRLKADLRGLKAEKGIELSGENRPQCPLTKCRGFQFSEEF